MHDASHKSTIQQAISILENDGHTTHAHSAKSFLSDLERGTVHADRAGSELRAEITAEIVCIDIYTYSKYVCNMAGLEHYYDPSTKRGLDLSQYANLLEFVDTWAPFILTLGVLDVDIAFKPELDFNHAYPSAVDHCQDHYDTALAIWRGQRPTDTGYAWADAMFHLGWACHFIADVCVSPHTVSNEFWGHSDYEDTIDSMQFSPDVHAISVGPKIQDYQLGDTAREIAVQAAVETRQELHLYCDDQWEEGACRAIPRAERFTARLLEKFLVEVKVENEPPPLRIWVLNADGHALPGASLFYRHEGGPWLHKTVDNLGFCRLALQSNEVVELRPAAAGHVFEGRFAGDAPCVPEFHGPASPVRYEQAPDPLYMPSIYFSLRTIFVRGVLRLPWNEIAEFLPFNQPYLGMPMERIEILVMGQQEGEEPELAVGSDRPAHLKVRIFDLLDITSGKLVRSVEDFGRQIEFKAAQADLGQLRERMRRPGEARFAPTKEARIALERTIRDDEPGGERIPYLGPKLGVTTSLSARTPSIMVTALGRYRVHVEVDATGGIGAPIGGPVPMAESRTDRNQEVFFRIKPGTEAGILNLRVSVDCEDQERFGYPFERNVAFLINPRDNGGPDELPMVSVSIEAL
jgi:hypothetical protein